jgi:hypothetical protein
VSIIFTGLLDSGKGKTKILVSSSTEAVRLDIRQIFSYFSKGP